MCVTGHYPSYGSFFTLLSVKVVFTKKFMSFLAVNKYQKDQHVKDVSGNKHFYSENPEYQITLLIRANTDF